jgi:4-diphosphocytidyl-2-C-methyl-D-erythritol kinase
VSEPSRAAAPAKLNLALLVGPLRADGKHEVATVLAPLALADEIELEPAPGLVVEGYPDDTLVHGALAALAAAAGTGQRWRVTIEKRIPVAAGLGGGSSDAAAALALANATLREPLAPSRLHALAAGIGADVPFFLTTGPNLARGDGTTLEPVSLRRDFDVVLLLPHDVSKSSTADVYRAFDARGGERGFAARAAELEAALMRGDLAGLPRNDLASSPHAQALEELGAFRADVTGAGPTVYGLFRDRVRADEAAREVEPLGRVWVDKPGW